MTIVYLWRPPKPVQMTTIRQKENVHWQQHHWVIGLNHFYWKHQYAKQLQSVRLTIHAGRLALLKAAPI